VRARVDLGDPPHRRSRNARSWDTATIAPGSRRRTPRAGEPVCVEVVRRLVEQEKVGLREEDCSERGARRLTARQPIERPVEVDAEPEPSTRGGSPRVEIPRLPTPGTGERAS
jgi:hypothetical protein